MKLAICLFFISLPTFACPDFTGKYLGYLADEKVVLSLEQEACEKINYTITYIPKNRDHHTVRISLPLDGKLRKVTATAEKETHMAGKFKGEILFLTSRYYIKAPQPGLEVSFETLEKTPTQGILDKGIYVDAKGNKSNFEVTFVPH